MLRGAAIGTSWQVRFAGSAPAGLRDAIERRFAAIVAEMSQWEPSSVLSRFNRASAGAWVTLPPDFATVIAAALDVAARSDGAFDPTHGRAAALLGFGAEAVTAPPSEAALGEARAAAGWQRLEWDSGARRLRQPGGLWLDLSGIAKGFAVDAIADLLRDHGLPDALVEVGGELAGRGLRPDRQPWWVDLESPPGVDLAPLRVGLHDLAVATSGDYVRGAHTIDPATGRPLARGTVSVSVIHASAMLADAWATALTVAGPPLAERESLAARFVGANETLSPQLSAMIAD
ncbi:FAD:protein FMN transferase [Sphingomonas immobilis]|uniref:FAD:protein FMN transferase n=1 Tax=Sphingomonas immobilis TaxID=3063997 RepID=UPI00272AF67A|nr:FAD:protein FMN transferase [Sphingomonas sp. CA1-15]